MDVADVVIPQTLACEQAHFWVMRTSGEEQTIRREGVSWKIAKNVF